MSLNAGTSLVGASISLRAYAGVPEWFAIGGILDGSVSLSGAGFSFAAAGTGYLIVGNTNFGSVSFSYDYSNGVLWKQLGQDVRAVAPAFENWYHWSSDQVSATLQGLKYTEAQVLSGLQAIGVWGRDVIAKLKASFGDNGSYWISANNGWYFPMFMDVSDSSQSPDARVIQWSATGRNNQAWFVVPTDGGWAELVNANSGQCLSAGFSWWNPGAPLVQYPCFGGANHRWYLGVYSAQANLDGMRTPLSNRATTNTGEHLVADVSGGDPTAGVADEVWTWNGNRNQYFTFTKAVIHF